MLSTVGELCPLKTVLLEVCCVEGGLLVNECDKTFGKGAACRVSSWNGGDLESAAGRDYVRRMVAELKPLVVWFSPDGSAYSPIQRMNRKNASQTDKLQAKQDKADKQYEGVAELFRAFARQGITCVLEMAESSEAWNQSWAQSLQHDLALYVGTCQGCQVNYRDYQGALLCKGWTLASTDGAMAQYMSLSCDRKHAQSRGLGYEGCKQQLYTKEFVRRVVRYLQRMQNWFETARHVQGGQDSCLAACEGTSQDGLGPAPSGIQDIPPEQRKNIFQNLRKIHTATGHCSNQHLKASLKKRGATDAVLRCVDHFSCDVCTERRRPDPRSPSTLQEIVPKWHTLQCDAFSWNHPETGEKWQFMLGIDEGSRLRVGKLLFQHQSRTPSAQDFMEYYEGNWFPNFGKPQLLRLDPAGCFRSKALDQYLAEREIEVSHIPAEAHWQISLAERSIQSIKDVMHALVMEQPSMTASEAFSRAIWASNHRDQYHGYSPLQHAFGRAPDELGRLGENKLREAPILTENGVSAEFGVDAKAMYVAEQAFLESQAKERIRRAELAGSRVMKQFSPGDLVFVWRRMTPKSDGNRHFKGGRFVGPYRVLATETRTDQDHQLHASHVIWLYRGGQLVKAAPQQLRPASSREEAWQEVKQDTTIPWTIADTLRNQPPHQFEDITGDSQHMPSPSVLQQAEDERERERVPKRVKGKQAPSKEGTKIRRQDADHQESTTNQESRNRSRSRERRDREDPDLLDVLTGDADMFEASSSVRTHRQRQRHTAKPSSSVPSQNQAQGLEQCGVVFPEEESAFWNTENPAVSFSLPLPHVKTRQGKEWSRDLGCYFAKQLRRNAVEISERHLSEEELVGFRQAKTKEVRNFIVAKAFQHLPSHLKPSKNQILRMRWLLTWKLDENPEGEPLKCDSQGNPLKPKARAVVLGYMDPMYEHRPTSSPTMSRTTRQLFLQCCANHGFQVEKGDISGAFLQGDDFGPDRPMICEPLPEICEALGVSAQTPMLLTKAAYGLVEAPIQWFLSVSRYLESLGGERQFSDPCCWGFFDKDRNPIGWVCGHVDDFLFGGKQGEAQWEHIKAQIKARFKWGQWESTKFLQCGVLIEQTDTGFALSQPEYLNAVTEIHVSRARWSDVTAPVTSQELFQLRSVLGALSWHEKSGGTELERSGRDAVVKDSQRNSSGNCGYQ